MKRLSKKLSIFFLLMLIKSSLLAQPDTGYFFKCYQTKNINFIEDEVHATYFECFLTEQDLKKTIFDSVKFDESIVWFDQTFAEVFKNNLYYTVTIPYKKEFLSSKCYVIDSIHYRKSFYKDFCYYFDRGEGYYFFVFVNKVIINYCLLQRFDELDFLFKKKITLAEPLVYLKLSSCERKTIENIF